MGQKSDNDASLIPTQVRLLDVAQELFAHHGFEGVSLRDIADGAGVKLASIVYHFSNKDGIYKAVLNRYALPLAEVRKKGILLADKSPSLKAYLDGYYATSIKYLCKRERLSYAKLLWRLPHEHAFIWRQYYDEQILPIREIFIRRIRPYCLHLSDEDFSWFIHVNTTIFYSTLGKYAVSSNKEDDRHWVKSKTKKAIQSCVVDSMLTLMTGASLIV